MAKWRRTTATTTAIATAIGTAIATAITNTTAIEVAIVMMMMVVGGADIIRDTIDTTANVIVTTAAAGIATPPHAATGTEGIEDGAAVTVTSAIATKIDRLKGPAEWPLQVHGRRWAHHPWVHHHWW